MNDTQRYAVYHAKDMLEVNLPPAMRWYAGAPSMKQHELHMPFGLFQVANYDEVSRRYISAIPDLAQEAPPSTNASRSPSSARAA